MQKILKVVIEPHGEIAGSGLVVSVMKALDHSHSGILPDFNNFGKYDRYDAVEKALPMHPQFVPRLLSLISRGRLDTDFERMLKILHDSDYSGVISIESKGTAWISAGSRMTRIDPAWS